MFNRLNQGGAVPLSRGGVLLLVLLASSTMLVGCSDSDAVATPQPTPLPSVPTFFEGTRITWIGNSGFLVTVRDTQVLLDGLFESYPGFPSAIRELIADARPPFDGVDVVLATHSHSDHFEATSVRRHLASNPRAIFVGPSDAAAQVTGFEGRVVAVELSEGERTELQANGISISAMYVSHGVPAPGVPSIVNLGYLITIANAKFFHPGDVDGAVGAAYFQSLGLPAERIDVGFVPYWVLSTPSDHPLVLEGIAPRYPVAMHFGGAEVPNYSLISGYFPNAVLFRTELESWVMP